MKPRAKSRERASFAQAVAAIKLLNLRPGLGAIKKSEGKGQIAILEGATVLGSVDIDGDCLKAHPNDARWDYVVGVSRESADVAHYIEVHSAHSSEVSKLAAKLSWLKAFVAQHAALSKIGAEYHWIASNGVHIPKHTRQYKALALLRQRESLQGPVAQLELA